MTQAEFANATREQAAWCQRLQSPLYAALLGRLAEDIERGGVCWRYLRDYAGEPWRSLAPLRFAAMLHRMALAGEWPQLARCLPSCGGVADPDGAWDAIVHADFRGRAMAAGVQTNEVGRSCGLAPGFLEIARATRLPLALFEIGSSAGLNLRWDHYRYGAWGPAEAEVVFPDAWSGEAAHADVRVTERRGCDLNPIDVTTEDGRLDLLSFVWPDQVDRFDLLARAIAVARRVPAQLERADAARWVARQFAERRPGVCTVLFHSVMWLYLSDAARAGIHAAMQAAGERAAADAPVAWLSMEAVPRGRADPVLPGVDQAEVALTLWPGGGRRVIAHSGYHGKGVVILPDTRTAR